ncbi:MAG TPA: heterodisulfide reductase-related iron-sulfur binding cluster [Pyrinomonadaceae bacterium]|nr:heterodisulfide reductase-related iron-sulfur binding cluster [Pyrinomonadaceae bacterium]
MTNTASSLLISTLATEEQKIIACVHCGLCLESCPTYVLTGDENDSPRGRIYLMRAVAEGRLSSDSDSFQKHIDRCLGCRACEPVCPAGVEYGQLLEAGRAELLTSAKKRNVSYRLLRLALRHVWLHPRRLRAAFSLARFARNLGFTRVLLKSRVARLLSKRFETGIALLQSSTPLLSSTQKVLTKTDTSSSDQRSAFLFTGCVTEGLFDRTNKATTRVLDVNGIAVEAPSGQVCCGALHAHAGDLEGARTLARMNVEAFDENAEAAIVTNAGGCGAMLVSYGHLLAHDAEFAERAEEFSKRVVDVSQQLAKCDVKQGAEIGAGRVTYDASCHLINGQRALEEPLRMLEAIPNLDFVPLTGADRCCGGAGVYNLLEPAMSNTILQEKLGHVKATKATILATGNPGCHMQIGAGSLLENMPLRVCHPVELLDESYRRAGMYESDE